MVQFNLRLFILNLAAIVLLGSLAVKATSADALFSPMPCPLQLPWDEEVEGETYDCGVVLVPENHNVPDGRHIELTFLRLKAMSLSAEPDPLVYLSGGPGGSAISEITSIAPLYQNMTSIRQRRDVIFLDQRGTGHSTLIACGPMSAAVGIAAETMDIGDVSIQELERMNAGEGSIEFVLSLCAAGYAGESIDLGQFNSISSANDIALLTRALGYVGQYNLYGTSYGTRLALVAMRETPDRIRSVILDGAVSPATAGTAETSTKVRYAYDTIFDLCMADKFCSDNYPDIRQRFIDLLEKLSSDPVTLDPPLIPNNMVRARFGSIEQITPKFFAELAMLNNGMARGGYATLVPMIIEAIELKDTTLLRKILGGGPIEEEVVVHAPLSFENAIEPDDVFFAPSLDLIMKFAEDHNDLESPSLSKNWVQSVIVDLRTKLINGEPQPVIIKSLVDLALLPIHGVDAERLIEFSDKNLSVEAAGTANSLVQAMDETDLRLTSWSIGDIAAQMGGFGERDGSPGMAVAMLMGINCIEEVGFTPTSFVEELLSNTPYPGLELRGVKDYELARLVCDFWPRPFEAGDIMYPVESDIATLIYTQGLDTQTVVKFGEDVATLLPNSFYHEWPTEGHVISGRSPDRCPGDIAAAFLDHPDSEPNMTCADNPYYTLPFDLVEGAYKNEASDD